jgi:hypothetical protein
VLRVAYLVVRFGDGLHQLVVLIFLDLVLIFGVSFVLLECHRHLIFLFLMLRLLVSQGVSTLREGRLELDLPRRRRDVLFIPFSVDFALRDPKRAVSAPSAFILRLFLVLITSVRVLGETIRGEPVGVEHLPVEVLRRLV